MITQAVVLIFVSFELLVCTLIVIACLDRLRNRVSALEQSNQVHHPGITISITGPSSIGDTIKYNDKLYEYVGQNTWRPKEKP